MLMIIVLNDFTALLLPFLLFLLLLLLLPFSYTPEKQVLKDFTLRVKEGEKLILLGASGSGKSSILKLLMGNRGKPKRRDFHWK